MLRYKTKTRPGLVALYDIQPGNGVGLFLQPRSPHEALQIRHSQCLSRNCRNSTVRHLTGLMPFLIINKQRQSGMRHKSSQSQSAKWGYLQ